MTPQGFKSRVQAGALVLMGLTTVYLVYYMYRSFYRAYRFSFGEPERWMRHWAVEPEAVVTQGSRVLYFGIWVLAIVLSVIAVIAALHLLNQCRKGVFFNAGTAKAIQRVGGLLVIAMLWDTVFAAVDLHIISWHNPSHVEPVMFRYDPSDIKVMVLAMVLFMFGRVMREGTEIEQTHREFV